MESPRSAYIHVPFCSHRCGYCNFTLVAGRDDLIEAYLEALDQEIASSLSTPVQVDTIFLGGGTPTHLPPPQLSRLLETIQKWFVTSADCEFSCEANPLDCSPDRLQTLRAGGVNRLSLGGQSFSDRKLQVLERDHSGDQLLQTLELCSRHFTNLSLDLIFAAPSETLLEWKTDILRALGASIQHLSTYGLTIERGAAFYGRTLRNDLVELEADLQLEMFEYAIAALTDAGWKHYEVSNFTRPGKHCRHNQAYWQGRPWWGFGPGAASFLPEGTSKMIRAVNHQSTTNYIRKILAGKTATAERVILDAEAQVRERLVFGLRQMEGIVLDDLDGCLGASARELFEPHLSRYIEQGWLEWHGQRLRLTPRGLMISDSLWPDLLA